MKAATALLLWLGACADREATPPVQAPPSEAPAPAPAEPPPPAPVIWTPGPAEAGQVPLAAGQPVLAICGAMLTRLPVRLETAAGVVNPTVDCDWQLLFAGLDDRVGPGRIAVGEVDGPLSFTEARKITVGFLDAEVFTEPRAQGYQVWLKTGDQRYLLAIMPSSRVPPVLVWAGDLDDDHAIDLVLNTPDAAGAAHYRVFLTARQPGGVPEQVLEYPVAAD